MPDLLADDGIRLHYADAGDAAGPAVVLLHGLGADASLNWDATGIGPTLVDAGFRTLALDQRGHGRSDRPHDPAAYRDHRFASDVSSLLDATGAGTCHLVGYSLGALMAMRAAPVEPRVRSVVLGGIGASSLDVPVDRAAIATTLEATGDPGPDAHPDGLVLRFVCDLTGADPLAVAACQRGRDPRPPDPSLVTAPALVVAGEDDAEAGSTKALAARLPHGQAATVPGDHSSALFSPELGEVILAFLLAQPS